MVKVIPPEHHFLDKKNDDKKNDGKTMKIQINEFPICNEWKLVLVMIMSPDEKILENL